MWRLLHFGDVRRLKLPSIFDGERIFKIEPDSQVSRRFLR